MTQNSRFGLDTFVILSLITGEPETLAEQASTFIEEAIREGVLLVVSDLVVCETYFALHWFYEVPKREALQALIAMFAEGSVVPADGPEIFGVLKQALKAGQKPGFVDRLVHARYSVAEATLVSFEKAARKLSGTRAL